MIELNPLVYRIAVLIVIFTFISCSPDADQTIEVPERVDSEELISDLKFLASDDLEGRRTGTEGNRMAQTFIENRFDSLGLETFGDNYRHLFNHTNPRTGDEFDEAVNMMGYVEGSVNPDLYIVVTAHYDHLGVSEGEIYNGADDNASGTSALLAAARWFSENPPENSIVFLAFDAEEQGLGGARWFVENPVMPLEQIVLNVNMDMISTNFENELYAVGTSHYPYLKPLIEAFTIHSDVNLLFGYDTDEWEQDWTLLSDHEPFHQKGIPFVYFGVEDHPHYHEPSDTFDTINPDFYVDAVETIIRVIEGFDFNIEEVMEASDRN